jgi:hypothetical protein
LGRFIGECCEVRKLAQMKSSTLFECYQQYAAAAGERWIPSKDLPHEMQRRGFDWKRTKTGSMYVGLELASGDEQNWRRVTAGDGTPASSSWRARIEKHMEHPSPDHGTFYGGIEF